MIKKITGALSLSLMASTALAGGLERSNQSVGVIFEDGNYAEMSFGTVNPSVTGVAGGVLASGNMANSYQAVGFAVKTQLSEDFSLSLVADQPYGADIGYTTAGYPLNGTNAQFSSNALTAIGRYELGGGFSAYAGIRHQSLDAQITIADAVTPFGYSGTLGSGSGTGYLAGVAFELPEIALRASLTYNSEIDSTHATDETVTGTAFVNIPGTVNVSSPKSWHLEAQSGIAEDTLMFGSVRWVNWSAFSVSPPIYSNPAVTNSPILSYANDSTTYTLGVGRRINDNWSASISARHEAASGGVGSDLAPNDGSTGLTLGARYTHENITVSGGVNYTWLGDTTTAVGTFADNNAIGAGFKVGVNF